MLGVVENMSGLRQRLGDFSFMRRDGPGGAERDATAEVLEQLRRIAPDLEVRQRAGCPGCCHCLRCAEG